MKFLVGKELLDDEEYDKWMRKQDREIDAVLDQELTSSGISFISFDSLKTVNETLQIFKKENTYKIEGKSIYNIFISL